MYPLQEQLVLLIPEVSPPSQKSEVLKHTTTCVSYESCNSSETDGKGQNQLATHSDDLDGVKSQTQRGDWKLQVICGREDL